jgi:hypothetical protein
LGQWIGSLLAPGGGLGRAVKAIFDLLVWAFNNAARIQKLVDTVTKGLLDLINGSGQDRVAAAVEGALGMLVVPAIDLLARLLGVNDIPDKLGKALMKVQDWIWDKVKAGLKWVVDKLGLDKLLGTDEGQRLGAPEKYELEGGVPPSSSGPFSPHRAEVRGPDVAGPAHRDRLRRLGERRHVQVAADPQHPLRSRAWD